MMINDPVFVLGLLGAVADQEKIARDAYVFMIVEVNSGWKLPLGYFFIAGLNSRGRYSLKKHYLC